MMPALSRDTIFAPSTGQPPAAIAIIRVSGPDAYKAIERLAGRVPPPRHARLAILRDPESADTLDHALTLFFPGPNSATGDDLAEFHLHGGRAVVAAVEAALGKLAGLRRAEPGEFTRRAFQNGRIDLAEAEGLADLLAAETEGQRRNAMALADGTLSRAIRNWRLRLIEIAAAIEARIDFADEDDVPDDDGSSFELITQLMAEMNAMLAAPPAERLRDGIRVVLAGPVNSGKSTLFNVLVGREAAIATPIPGTTRDIIEYPVQIDGIPFIFVDTAGLRDSIDTVEQIGIERARVALGSADLMLWLGAPIECPKVPNALRLISRCDLQDNTAREQDGDLAVSAVTGAGIVALRQWLVSRGTLLLPREGEIALDKRQSLALRDAADALEQHISNSRDILLLAESIRLARSALDRLTGDGGVEPLLDAIFSRFCIGK